MPLIDPSDYQPPWIFKNKHLQTIYPTLFRRVKGVRYTRQRIETPDGDFIDLDVAGVGADRAVILLHGLEGHSQRKYMLGMARALNQSGIDSLSFNFRGCSGEPNRKVHFYHSGFTQDLRTVIAHVEKSARYRRIDLIGFSIGGNMTLKYLGENPQDVSPLIQKTVCFSVPIDLSACAIKMDEPAQAIYLKRFLRLFRQKIEMKQAMWQGEASPFLSLDGFDAIHSFFSFDDRYTGPMFGYANAKEYYAANSSKQFLDRIQIPTLLVTALDDPFLDESCFPRGVAKENPNFFLETPAKGGHMGFISSNSASQYWSEKRALEFLR